MRYSWAKYVAAALLSACGPAEPPGYAPSDAQWAEIEQRRAELLDCVQAAGGRLRWKDPIVRVDGDCRVESTSGRSVRGYTDMREYVVVPARDLGALAHEYAHWYAQDWGHAGLTTSCGDPIDARFLRDKGYPCRDD